MSAAIKPVPTASKAVAGGTAPQELDALRAEVARLRGLLGPSEDAYVTLRLDVLAARDSAIGAEAALGEVRAQVTRLEAEVEELRAAAEAADEDLVARTLRVLGRGPAAAPTRKRFSR
jgi:hypothetical protein